MWLHLLAKWASKRATLFVAKVAELAAIGADATGENYCVAYLWDALLTHRTVVDGVDLKARVAALTGFSLCDTKHFSSSRHV